jgi:hypothetical protein
MNRLQAELQRLFLAPDAQGPVPGAAETGAIGPDDGVRGMVLELAGPASWTALANAWRGVQADLELPAPAIAVSGSDGYQLWFSFSEPVPVAQATAFLESLRGRYLGDLAPQRVSIKAAGHVALPPVRQAAGRWSAFVAPDLAAVFADEPWLDLAPGPDAQADLLSRLACTKPDALQRAMELLARVAPAGPQAGPSGTRTPAPVAADGPGPRRFLLEVMNDRTVDLRLRIDAAKALLPYCESERPL